jgi:hypothetical protein
MVVEKKISLKFVQVRYLQPGAGNTTEQGTQHGLL